ncbi:LacI family DNA-binding transcriptional regulator [Algisphaera agarilytica]|uniref:LacI family transcriptional regulator n=1 Tax=Algisphaera agarilytica TaxID=1385975 RepID=A0A7X0H340_9BACT|nr:LacI family DNA-binding transcriptional regulator [Algisphaera agarilytica]MBB6428393.1 LacI family transcriptional regulator [Algisphaera agarilytica]
MSIVEVAKLAGCSHTTVSRVINQKPGVSVEVASRVQAAMRKLSYVPPVKRRGPQPKSGRAARTGNVAVLMIGTEATPLIAPASAAAIHAVETALGDQGYSMTLGQVRDNTRLPSVVDRGEIDGLILHGNAPRGEFAEKLRRFPAVWVMSARSRSGYWGDRVVTDNDAIGRLAAEYLIDRGHRRVAFLYVDATHLGFPVRAESFAQAAEDAGVACEIIRDQESPSFAAGDFRAKREFINSLIDRLAALPEPPTGLFVPRGQMTPMVFEALRSRVIEPGRDVTVVACDNDPMLAGLSPQIATIDIRPDRIGTLAVEQLMQRIDKPEIYARANILVEPTLVDLVDVD